MTEFSLFTFHFNAGVAELADAQDLGSCVTDVGVQVPSPAPFDLHNPTLEFRLFIKSYYIGTPAYKPL